MDSANITVVGSLMVDHIFFINRLPDIGETYPTDKYQKAPGGKGANAAIATHRTCHTKPQPQTPSPSKASLDINVRMVGAVGKDAEGTYMLDALRRNNMDDAGVARVDENTGMMFVMVQQTEDSVDNRLISTIGANATLKPESFATEDTLHVVKGTQPDLIVTQLELELATIERILETAGKAGIKVLLNAAPAITILSELYRYVTHLIVNETEAAILSGREVNEVCKETWKEIAQEFLQEGIENVVITLGADGAFYANSDDFGHIPAFKIDPVDPTGAGDTFTGAYAAEYVRQQRCEKGWDIKSAVRRACAAGALTVMQAGAQDGIPWADEIDAFMEQHEASQALDETDDVTGLDVPQDPKL